MHIYAGIDLAALPKNPTGMASYDGTRFKCDTLKDDVSILNFIDALKPCVVAIDAPLTLPRGRCCFDDDCCGPAKIRQCDRMLISRGYRVFPPGYSFMKQLTIRGKHLRERLEDTGYRVIETHPRTAKKILGLGEKSLDTGAKSEHEFDACMCAIVAMYYDLGMYEELGDDEGVVVIPRAHG